ncbi:MAG TPA: TonB-dependent receptor [Gammaproteobacteria bacterium]
METKRGLATAVAAALGSAGFAGIAVAQQGAGPILEEVVVTARRYEESITDAPLAVAVMDADFLEQNQVDSVTDILDITPGASWGMFAKAQPTFTLRGISAATFGNSSIEQAVQVVQDGLPVTKVFMATVTPFDLERVEVMRGPQGTTFGRNATLGLIHFVSARPSDEFSAGIDLKAGEQEMFGATGFINGALSDTVSGRLAFNYHDTHQGIEDAVTGEPLEGSENQAFRASLLFEPSDSFSAYLKMEFNHDEDLPVVRRQRGCTPGWLNNNTFQDPATGVGYSSPCDPWLAEIDQTRTDWNVERDMISLMGEFSWALDNDMTLTALAGYMDGDHTSVQDAFGTPFAIRDQLVWNDADILSGEIRLDNAASGDRIRWLVGASFVTDEETRREDNIQFPERLNSPANLNGPLGYCGGQVNLPAPGGCPEWTLVTDSRNETESYGLFGELQFDLSDTVTLALGGRYSDDTRDYTFSTWGWGEANGLQALGLGNGARDCNANKILDPLGRMRNNMGMIVPYEICGSSTNTMGFDDSLSRSWDDFSTKVSIAWALNDNNNVYALYSEGFKGGGFQHDARSQNVLRDFAIDSETAENIEFGWKMSYDRFRGALTVFQQTQDNVQANNQVPCGVGSTGNCNVILNTGGVENTGVEFEFAWAATQSLEFGGSIASYDPEYSAGALQGGMFDPVTGTFAGEDISGTVPSGSPEFTYYLYGDYEWALGNGGSLRLRADVNHMDPRWQQNGASNRCGLNLAGTDFEYRRPELDKLGLSLTWSNADDDISVSLWGRNLDDDPDYINTGPAIGFIFNLGAPGEGGCRVRSRPVGETGRSQVGLSASFRF